MGDISVAFSAETVEWYTPWKYIAAARAVMGGIDTDPASCAAANVTVGAASFFDATSDGLAHDWRGRVWMNPPYGTHKGRKIGDWINKLIAEYRSGRTTAAIVLVNANTEVRWFAPLFDFPICLTLGRISFDSPTGGKNSPIRGSAFAYLGSKVDLFRQEFSAFGPVVMRLPTSEVGP